MDVDANRRGQTGSLVCYQCKAPGHVAKYCPQCFDIRFLTIEERWEYLEACTMAVDTLEAKTSVIDNLAKGPPMPAESKAEGFHNHNK